MCGLKYISCVTLTVTGDTYCTGGILTITGIQLHGIFLSADTYALYVVRTHCGCCLCKFRYCHKATHLS